MLSITEYFIRTENILLNRKPFQFYTFKLLEHIFFQTQQVLYVHVYWTPLAWFKTVALPDHIFYKSCKLLILK